MVCCIFFKFSCGKVRGEKNISTDKVKKTFLFFLCQVLGPCFFDFQLDSEFFPAGSDVFRDPDGTAVLICQADQDREFLSVFISRLFEEFLRFFELLLLKACILLSALSTFSVSEKISIKILIRRRFIDAAQYF